MSALTVTPARPCGRSRNGEHQFDWGGSGMAVLTSYGRSSDHQAVVRLSACRSCGEPLLAVASSDADDEDLGVLLSITGSEVGEG